VEWNGPGFARATIVVASGAKQSSRATAGALQNARNSPLMPRFFVWRASRALDCFVASLLAMTGVGFTWPEKNIEIRLEVIMLALPS
jgi:hypothetical protein